MKSLLFNLIVLALLPVMTRGQFWVDQQKGWELSEYHGSDFVLLKGRKDTIFCDRVEMKMSSNDPVKLSFKIDGRDTVINWSGCLNAIAFQADGKLMELMPANPEKPYKAHQHMFRMVTGYITVWSNNHKWTEHFVKPDEFNRMSREHQMDFELISINDGPLFIPSAKNYRTYLSPLYDKCDWKKDNYKSPLDGMASGADYYNRFCAPER